MSLSKTNTNLLLNVLGGLVIAYAWAAPVVLGAIWLFGDVPDTDVSLPTRIFWMGVPLIASIAMGIGLKVRSHSPRRGLHLITAGALGPAIWFLPIYAPVLIAVIALAISVTPRKETRLAAA